MKITVKEIQSEMLAKKFIKKKHIFLNFLGTFLQS